MASRSTDSGVHRRLALALAAASVLLPAKLASAQDYITDHLGLTPPFSLHHRRQAPHVAAR